MSPFIEPGGAHSRGTRPLFARTVIAATCVVLIAACGGNDVDPGTASTSPVTSEAATDATTSVAPGSDSVAATPGSSTAVGAGADVCEPRDHRIEVAADGSPVTTQRSPETNVAGSVAASFCADWTVTLPDETERTFSPTPKLTRVDAECMGDGIVDALGASRPLELGLGFGPWSLLSIGLGNNQPPRHLDRHEAEAIADVAAACTADWKLLFVNSVTSGADQISDTSARCAADLIDDATAREILVSELDRAYDDPSQPDAEPYPDNVQPLIEALESCATPEELSGLDWN